MVRPEAARRCPIDSVDTFSATCCFTLLDSLEEIRPMHWGMAVAVFPDLKS
jgi:hypothetical protein